MYTYDAYIYIYIYIHTYPATLAVCARGRRHSAGCSAQLILEHHAHAHEHTNLTNFENVSLVARRKEHFRGFWSIFLVAQLPPKEVFWYTQEFTRLLSNCARGFLGGGAKKRRTNEEE